MKRDLKWLFLDLNSYFASVEQNEHPELRGKPVAIVPMQTDSTCAIAASYEAKAFGVKTGTLIYQAKKMCPGLICIPANHKLYVDYHHRIMDEVENHLPIHQKFSIDEVGCKLLGAEKEMANAIRLAQNIKAGLRKNVGPNITCSIGLAPNNLLAKIGTEMQKPDGLVTLPPEDLPGKFARFPLQTIPGIGPNMLKRLQRVGIHTIQQLYDLPPKQVRAIWGGVQGERLWLQLHGQDVPHEETTRRMIGHSRILPPNLRPAEEARKVGRLLTVKAARRLRREGYFTKRFVISLRFENKDKYTHEIPLPYSNDDFTFLNSLEHFWATIPTHLQRQRVKKVSVVFHHLTPVGQESGDLFENASAHSTKEAKARFKTLTTTIDGLVDKYDDPTIVRLGDIADTHKMHDLGTKIAFSRIPDKEEFRE